MREDIKKKAEEIAIDFAKSIKERTDALLKLDCDLYTNLGIDSSKEEKKEVKEVSKFIYTRVALLDEDSGKVLLKALDK
mgnify:CR=1 FL=1